ncbi:MAG: hypothetical protein GC161_12120 [Planctomycetaceae bacterium]|nr:hypothetical protein [Planctomycetaceae bacterium]
MDRPFSLSPDAAAPCPERRSATGPGLAEVWTAIERDLLSAARGLGTTMDRLGRAELPRETAAELATLKGTVASLEASLAEYSQLVQLHTGRAPEAPGEVDAIELLENLAVSVAPTAWTRGVELAVVPPAGALRLHTRVEALGSVLRQLLDEALDGAPPGRLELRVESADQGGLRFVFDGGAATRARVHRRGRRALLAALFDGRLGLLGAGLERDGTRQSLKLRGCTASADESIVGASNVGLEVGVLGADDRSAASTAAMLAAIGASPRVLCDEESLAAWSLAELAVLAVDEERWEGARTLLRQVAAAGAPAPATLWLGAGTGGPDPARFAALGADLWLTRPLDRRRLSGALRLLAPGPARQPATPKAALPAPRPVRSRTLRRVLVGHGHLLELAELAAHLTAAGWDVVQADDGDGLVRELNRGGFEILIYSAELEGFRPEDLQRQLESHPTNRPRCVLWLREGSPGAWPRDEIVEHRAPRDCARSILHSEPTTREASMEQQSHDVLDPQVIASLRELDEPGEPGLLEELVDIFLSDAPTRVAALEEALAAGDGAQLERVAHSLKSSCGNLGAKTLAELCRQIEANGRQGRLEGIASLVARSRQAFAEVQRALEIEIGRA